MKVKVIVSFAHDTTLDKIYDTINPPHGCYAEDDEVWIIDDVGDEYILLDGEFEVVE